MGSVRIIAAVIMTGKIMTKKRSSPRDNLHERVEKAVES